jgi:SprT protein
MNAELSPAAIAAIRRWLDLWNISDLGARTTIEYSTRLTRSLGRCYPERRIIRLASFLDESDNSLIEEVLCHELAHIAARELHRGRIRPHGREWKALMRAAGFEPRTRLPAPPNAPNPSRTRHLYVHRCPVCQRSRIARRSMRRWRCRACLDAGLDGVLTITHTAT